MLVKDIKGASVRVPYQRKSAYDNMNYKEINDEYWQTKRQGHNPLQPEYVVRDKIIDGD